VLPLADLLQKMDFFRAVSYFLQDFTNRLAGLTGKKFLTKNLFQRFSR